MDPAKIWYTVSFFLFLLAVYRPIKSQLLPALDNYRDETAKKMNDAKQLHDDAQKLVERYTAELQEMEKTYAEMLSKTKDDIITMRSQMLRQKQITVENIKNSSVMQQQQLMLRGQTDFENYVILFIKKSLTEIITTNSNLQDAYQLDCLKRLSQG